MPYDASDLRSQLGSATGGPRADGATLAPQYFVFPTLEPDEVSPLGSKSWYVRSQNCCVAFTLARPGERLGRDDQPDEYMVLLHSPDSSVVVSANGDRREVMGSAVIVVPPGKSEVAVEAQGMVARVFSNQAQDVLERCSNADVYAEPDPNVAPFQPWPDPPDGYKVRVYPLADIKPDPARFGRILRCSTMMVNYFYVDDEPRDPAKLSPHHHDDFEQISLTLEGDYVHHMRTPWTVDMSAWRPDEHHYTPSPAVTVIPPPVVHTSQAVNHMRHQLIDIFCPPRMDFSQRPGWVLNSDDYSALPDDYPMVPPA